jgi:hypothetical protein
MTYDPCCIGIIIGVVISILSLSIVGGLIAFFAFLINKESKNWR